MNATSLAHIDIINQQKPSWNDDPFDLKGSFAGVAKMNHQRNLEDFAQELVYLYGIKSAGNYNLQLSKLSDDDQNELVRLYLEANGRELTECVNGNDFSIENEYTCALLAMLKDDCKETREAFADITRKNILTYYSESLQNVLDEGCHDLFCHLNNEAGYHSYQDQESGDICWRSL